MKRQLPKNVRQIGNVSDSSKIYVEDYVDTFFNQMSENADVDTLGAFLVGEIVREEEQDYIYIYGAIRMKELEKKGRDFVVGDDAWKNACETCKEYFGSAEIVGWVLTGVDLPEEANHNLMKIHQKYFPREQSLLVLKNARDKEEKFYVYKYRHMMESPGHYIYYERNAEMQNYMIAMRKKVGLTPSEIIEDRVAKNFRNIIQEKEKKKEHKSTSRITYALSTFLILIVAVIGVTMLNNYEKMKNIKKSLEQVEEDESIVIDVLEENVEAEIEEPEVEVVEDTTEAYIVQKGDTLESICVNRYGDNLRIREICELNELSDGNLIYIGQKILLP